MSAWCPSRPLGLLFSCVPFPRLVRARRLSVRVPAAIAAGSLGSLDLFGVSAFLRYDAFLACNENAAPWGSTAFTTQSPPGTSVGPLTILPPFFLTRSTAALISGTRK